MKASRGLATASIAHSKGKRALAEGSRPLREGLVSLGKLLVSLRNHLFCSRLRWFCARTARIPRGKVVVDVARAGVGRGERRLPRLEDLSDRHHVDRADAGQLLNDGHEIEPTVRPQKRAAPNLPRHGAIGGDFVDGAADGVARDIVFRREIALVGKAARIAPLAGLNAITKRMLDFRGDQFRHRSQPF